MALKKGFPPFFPYWNNISFLVPCHPIYFCFNESHDSIIQNKKSSLSESFKLPGKSCTTLKWNLPYLEIEEILKNMVLCQLSHRKYPTYIRSNVIRISTREWKKSFLPLVQKASSNHFQPKFFHSSKLPHFLRHRLLVVLVYILLWETNRQKYSPSSLVLSGFYDWC